MKDILKIAEQWGKPHSLLVVDDEAVVRMAFSTVGNAHHCEMFFAPSVTEAINYIDRRKFDFIFLDMKLEGSHGLEVLRYINREDIDAHVTIMSGSINLGDIMREANNLGVLSFFSKPVDFTPAFVKKILTRVGVRLVPKNG